MKKAFLLGCAFAAWAAPVLAQAPAAPPPAPPVRDNFANCPPNALRAQGGNPINEPPANNAVGVDVDRFIGDPAKSISTITRNAIQTRAILTQGDPAQPGKAGAVLRFRHDVSLYTMMAGEESDLSPMDGQQVIYVEGGKGRLDDGNVSWELREGLVLLIPANHPQRFVNTGDGPLTMLAMTDRPHPEATPIPDIVVRDVAKMQYSEQGAHWANLSKSPFSDYGVRFLIVHMGPMSIAGPHAHDVPTEEGWVMLTDGPTYLNMGSELRPWRRNVGIIAPNTCQTVHGAINTSNRVQAWFYFAATDTPARLPVQGGRGGRGAQAGRGAAIAASVTRSTIPGTPLAQAPRGR